MITEFDSIFHENGFIFVNERSSYNRNGNREGIGATTAAEYEEKKKKYKDPRDKMRGATGRNRSFNQRDRDNATRVTDTVDAFNKHKENANNKNNKIIERNADGSQKHVNATRSNESWDKASHSYKAKEKIVKHYQKKEKQAVNASALMESIELI